MVGGAVGTAGEVAGSDSVVVGSGSVVAGVVGSGSVVVGSGSVVVGSGYSLVVGVEPTGISAGSGFGNTRNAMASTGVTTFRPGSPLKTTNSGT